MKEQNKESDRNSTLSNKKNIVENENFTSFYNLSQSNKKNKEMLKRKKNSVDDYEPMKKKKKKNKKVEGKRQKTETVDENEDLIENDTLLDCISPSIIADEIISPKSEYLKRKLNFIT